MAKYKCPKCGTIYHEIPRFCATCGVEFLPAEEQDQPKVVAAVAPEQAPVAQPVEEAKPAPVEEKPVEAAPAPVEEKPVEKAAPATNNSESSELNITSNKEKVPARVIVGFIFAFLTIFVYLFTNIIPYLREMSPEPRVYMILGFAIGSLVLSICTLAIGGRPGQYKKGHGMAVFARVIGIIFLILSIIDVLAWTSVTVLYLSSAKLESTFNFSFKDTIDRFLMTGKIEVIKLK